jgi:hypothetical protein
MSRRIGDVSRRAFTEVLLRHINLTVSAMMTEGDVREMHAMKL